MKNSRPWSLRGIWRKRTATFSSPPANGTVKKTGLAEFSNPRPSGIIALNLDADDELIGAKLTDGKQMIFLASHDGQAILFRETEVRSMGRSAGGVNGMDLAKGDFVVSMDAAQPDFGIIQKGVQDGARKIWMNSKAINFESRSHR